MVNESQVNNLSLCTINCNYVTIYRRACGMYNKTLQKLYGIGKIKNGKTRI